MTEEKLRIEYRKLSDLELWADNPKLHDQGGIAGSIEAHKFRDAPIWDETLGAIVAGNGRIKVLGAMKAQGMPRPPGILEENGDWLVPVQMGVNAESIADARAFALDHNNLTLAGGDFAPWDLARMYDETGYMAILSELAAEGALPVSVDGDDLDALLAQFIEQEEVEEPEQIDRAEELQEKWQVQRGQVWEIPSLMLAGKYHRVMCGDSTAEEDVGRLMGGMSIGIVITDPPYGTETNTSWLSALHVQRGKPANLSDDQLKGDDGSLDTSICFRTKKWFVWGFPFVAHPDMTGWLVWDKWPGVESGGGLGSPIEMASTNLWKGFRIIRFMWGGYYKASGEKREPHPTQKPSGVIMPFLEQYTKAEDIVADYFLGSGTTLVACEKTGRIGYGMEIEPKYCAVTLERLSGLGLEPKLVS